MGENTSYLRERVAAEFEKQRSLDEIAAFLPTVYRGGVGVSVDGEHYSAWMNTDGIRIAQGNAARYEHNAQIIPWSDAAERISELLNTGQYAGSWELERSAATERELLAQQKAHVDLPYMAQLCSKDKAEIADELQGAIFCIPGTDRYVTADEYLSGNVRQKLREAEDAAENDAAFNVNVEALRAAQPRELTASEIDVRLGATWIEPRYIKKFIDETFKPSFWASQSIKVHYSPVTGEWCVEGKSAVGANDVNAYNTYGTSRMNAYKILENTLNLRDVRVYDGVEHPDGSIKRVLNVKETTLAQQKQQVIKDAFKDWLWKDADRR